MYKKLFDMSLDMLCIANFEGYFEVVNPAFSKTLGYTEEELLSKPFVEFVHPEDRPKTNNEIELQSAGEETVLFENRYLHKDGYYITLSWSSSVDMEEKRFYAVARDITEMRRAESKLSQIYSTLESHAIIATTDTSGTITEVNDNFCEISGYSREELIGQNHRIVNSDAHSEEFFTNMWNQISSGKTWTGLIQNKKKNGEDYYVQSIIFPTLDLNNEISQYTALRFDMTKAINLEENLNRIVKILNETGAIAKVGGWELNVETGELNWTDETFKILEVQKKEDQKPQLPEGLSLFTPRCKPIIEEAVNNAIQNGEPYSLELEAQTANGNVRWIHTSGKANYKAGKIVTLSGTIQDIHEKKLVQIKLEEEYRKNILQSKLATLGEISAGIVHEINNPLTVVMGYLKMLPDYLHDSKECQKRIDVMVNSCGKITQIIDNMKNLIHTSNDGSFNPCLLSSIVKESIQFTSIRAKRINCKVELETTNDALINCDQTQIEQVIVNLVNNAIDATEKYDEKWVSLFLEEDSKNVILKICDSGTGMTPEVFEKLFEPFYTTKEIGKGTGLGLSIAKGIIEVHKGQIYLDLNSSTTCFVIEFPKYTY